MTTRKIAVDVPESVLLAEKTDEHAFARELRMLAAVKLAPEPTHDRSVSRLSRERRLKALRANLKGSKSAVSREDTLRYIAEGRDRR